MREEKMVALWGRNQGFFLPSHPITLGPPNIHAGFKEQVCVKCGFWQGWEFSTVITLKARVIAETRSWELLGQRYFLNPISMDSQTFYKMRFFFQKILFLYSFSRFDVCFVLCIHWTSLCRLIWNKRWCWLSNKWNVLDVLY